MNIWKKLFPVLTSLLLFIALKSNALFAAPIADGFDYPLGKPPGQGYGVTCCGGLGYLEQHDYSGDGIKEYHPGEDWNNDRSGDDLGGDRNDKNDPVFAVAAGQVIYSKFSGNSWGDIVLIEHQMPSGTKLWSQYAHLSSSAVSPGQVVVRGQEIGRVGDYFRGTGRAYHLHFEVRKIYRGPTDFVMNWSKERVIENYYNPSEFIDAHRPVAGQTLTAKQEGSNKITLSWNKSESDKFDKYELYRSEVAGGTGDESKRTLVFSGTGKEVVTAVDEKVTPGATFYYRLYTLYKNGLVGVSEEVAIEQKREIVQITNNPFDQKYPVIAGGKIFWQDSRTINNRNPQQLYFYDLESKEEESVQIGSLTDGVKIPMSPAANGAKVVYFVGDNSGTGNNIYCYNFETGSYFPVTRFTKEQLSPDISEEGIVVWEDMRDGTSDIYYLDLNKSEGEKVLVSEKFNQKNPKIWGNKVIWKDTRVGNRTDLYIKEIGGEEELLATSVKDGAPAIWEDWVVWATGGKVSLINTETKETKVISETNGFNPKVRDGKVVYYKQECEFGYIYVYDIETATETKIDFKLNYMSYPSVYGNMVVFDHSEKQTIPNMEIYLVYI